MKILLNIIQWDLLADCPIKYAAKMLSHVSCVQLCATPQMAAQQAPPSLGFSRQEHWSGLPFPSPMHESEKWKWSHSVSVRLFVIPWTAALQAPPWEFPAKSTGVGRQCLLCNSSIFVLKKDFMIFEIIHDSGLWSDLHLLDTSTLPVYLWKINCSKAFISCTTHLLRNSVGFPME